MVTQSMSPYALMLVAILAACDPVATPAPGEPLGTDGAVASSAAAGEPASPAADSDAGSSDSRGALVSLSVPDLPPPAPTECVTQLSAHGNGALCSSCACGRCSERADACNALSGCAALAACMHESGCTGIECFCGDSLIGCAFEAGGPCVSELRALQGDLTEEALLAALGDAQSPLAMAAGLVACTRTERKCTVECAPPGEECSFVDLACVYRRCQPDSALLAARAASAQRFDTPSIRRLQINGSEAWHEGAPPPTLRPGDLVTLEGEGFGAGPDVDFAKLLLGHTRVLESDLFMYESQFDLTKMAPYETSKVHSQWPKDIVSWTDTRVEFRVPSHVARGPLTIQVQKRTGSTESLSAPGQPHLALDPQQLRIEDPDFNHRCDVVSQLSRPRVSNAIELQIDNPGLEALVSHGRRIFWSYDYNLGVAQSTLLDWKAILEGKKTDPVTSQPADSKLLFGAHPAVAGEVPAEALEDVPFDPYPVRTPVPGFLGLGSQRTGGMTRNSGFVGYRYAESNHPVAGAGEWIGFNCASCHTQRITWERAPGQTITKMVPGLPNPRWSVKFFLLGEPLPLGASVIALDEEGPLWAPGVAYVDKTNAFYAVPHGTAEHTLGRPAGNGTHVDNDNGFAPITIPNVTYYLPIRRSLGRTESNVGFEGSYIHPEEPEGAFGSMDAASLKALTAYMGRLDQYDGELRRVGLYRHIAHKGLAQLHGGAGEGAFVERGPEAFPAVRERLQRGAEIFEARCGDCHGDPSGSFTNERMLALHQVGRFFEPSAFQVEMQSIRVTFLRDVYFTQQRGLLSDGHVRNVEELVHPDRCREGSALYARYYTLHEPSSDLPATGYEPQTLAPHENPRGDVFRVIKERGDDDVARARNAHLERYRYFVTVPWDGDHYYWDYQKFRREYGPWELGTAQPIGMPAAPHPWCAGSPDEVDDLVLYLMSL